MKKVRIGVLGGYRGTGLINYCENANNAVLVAICDKNEDVINTQKKSLNNDSITYYTDFDEFLKHDMDAVVLANYANEHAPFAIRCMEAGLNVYSEVLPVQTMKEAVELVEAVERTGKIYAYGENYCYMPAPYEMRRLYREGKLGEFEYGECEYLHNCAPIWHSITYGNPSHWRNTMYAHFYCTHSLGPMIHITGLRPVSVTGIEGKRTERDASVGALKGSFGIEMVTLENGGVVKSIHGDLYKNSIWYSIYGSKGRAESAREDAECGGVQKIYVNVDEYPGEYAERKPEAYEPKNETAAELANSAHGGGDFYAMYNFAEKILGNENADIIDVYEALDMFLPGMFAYRSVLQGGIPMQIPNLRDKAVREQYRNDTMCTDKKVAGDMYIPSFSKGNPEIPDIVYENMKKKYDEEFKSQTGYVKAAFTQNKKDK